MNKQCEKCESDQYVLTSGRCYLRSFGCSLQVAATCIVCQAGLIRTGGSCEKSPENIIPDPTNTKSTSVEIKQKVITSTGTKNIVYEMFGANCLKY